MTTMANAAAAMQNARTAAPKLYGDMTKDEILERVANYIENNYGGRAFKTLREVEEQRLSELDATKAIGTVAAPVNEALATLGFQTDGTIGSARRGLQFSQAELDETACHCLIMSETISGTGFARRLRSRMGK